jgi:hypothetical protein
VKSLTLTDRWGNGDSCSLLLPDQMTRWKLSALREFLAAGNQGAAGDGFLPRAPEPLRFEPFRQLMMFPELTCNRPVTFEQNDRPLRDDDSIDLTGPMSCVILDRDQDGGAPDSAMISVAARNRNAFESNRNALTELIDELFDFTARLIVSVDSKPITSFSQLVSDFDELLDTANKVRFLFGIAQVIHAAPFENFSKIIAGRQFRCGYEMWGNMAQGFGGVCGEKTAAFRFVCDVLSIPSRPVLGSDTVIPDDFEESMRAYVDSGGSEELPLDIHHHILEITVDSSRYLVDATNGNIPMLFLDGDDSDTLIGNGFRTRMVYRVDRLSMQRSSTWTGDAIETLSEYHVPELHMQYIFKQGLGLHISRRAYIGVYFDWGGQASALKQNYYSSRAKKLRFPYPRFVHAGNMDSVPDPELSQLLTQTLKALRNQYSDKQYTGDFTFVIQPLTPHFWTLPHVSESVKRLLLQEVS